jgi:hypothetical protein
MRLTLDMRQAGGDWLLMANYYLHNCFFVFEVFSGKNYGTTAYYSDLNIKN